MAPRVGLEPTTLSLTARRSTIELPRNIVSAVYFLTIAPMLRSGFRLHVGKLPRNTKLHHLLYLIL